MAATPVTTLLSLWRRWKGAPANCGAAQGCGEDLAQLSLLHPTLNVKRMKWSGRIGALLSSSYGQEAQRLPGYLFGGLDRCDRSANGAEFVRRMGKLCQNLFDKSLTIRGRIGCSVCGSV